jgi:F-type H+-transporting ATPase subunit b
VRIDLFTLGAQIFNFALLVILLRFVLYRPILNAIRRREEEVARRLDEARASREEAEQEAERYRRETERVEQDRARALAEAEEEAAQLRERLGAQVREGVDRSRKEWQDALGREREAFLAELRASVGRQVFAVAKETFRAVADASLEGRVIDVFVRRLHDMSAEDRAEFERVAHTADAGIRVRSAMPMPEEQQNTLRGVFASWLGEEVDVVFETDARLTLGVEVVTGDRKIGWSVASHLDALEAEAKALLDRATR